MYSAVLLMVIYLFLWIVWAGHTQTAFRPNMI